MISHLCSSVIPYHIGNKFATYVTARGVYIRVRNEKIDNHEITSLLFQPVGHIKVFFYVPIKLIYLSSYDGNHDCFVLEIVKNCALSG